MLKLYNTLTRKKQVFRPLRDKRAGLYACGPTVYSYAHIGNLRTYIFEDILRRTLEYNRYKTKHVMNITDVGHLTSDDDWGDDKMEKGAKREKKTVWEIAEFYTRAFLKDIERLNIKKPHKFVPASRYVEKQIVLIKRLFQKKYAYETSQAVYFDVSKFKNYTKLSGQKLSQKIAAAREEIVVDPEKRSPCDFALWFKIAGKFKNHIMRWPSPWGMGFPGWHIECSAISSGELGQPFDIHAGGVDHINVHHSNEIAQSEAAFEKPLARFWLHGEFLLIDSAKMAKSENRFLTLEALVKKGFNPLAFRYLVLTAHYRSKLNFTWKSISASRNSLNRLYEFIRELSSQTQKPNRFAVRQMAEQTTSKNKKSAAKYEKIFLAAINDDLNMPKAVALVWQIVKDKKLSLNTQKQLILKFDKVLGLGLAEAKSPEIPLKIKQLAAKREQLRINKQFVQADVLRKEIEALGYKLKDTANGPQITAARY